MSNGDAESVLSSYANAIKGKEDKFRLTTMPEASATYANGKPYQYIGATGSGFKHNFFYECKPQGTEPETYAWEEVSTGSGDSRISSVITGVGVMIDDGFRPYFNIDLAQAIPPFADASLSDIITITNAYYDGEITLADIKNVWSKGDSKTMTVSAMSATGVAESHAEQTVTLKIAGFDHDTLVDSIGEITKPLLSLGFELAEDGAMGGTISNGWTDSTRRTWCNSVCKNALPAVLRENIKTVVKTTDGYVDSNWTESGAQQNKYYARTTNDDVWLPTIIEMIGRTATKGEICYGSTIAYFSGQGGTQYEGHALANFRSKTIVSSTTCYWSDYGSARKGPHPTYEIATTAGASGGVSVDTASGLMPHFCI